MCHRSKGQQSSRSRQSGVFSLPSNASGWKTVAAPMPYFGWPPMWTLNLPRFDCAPMPVFFRAPPITPMPCPLKWVRAISTSAAAMAWAT